MKITIDDTAKTVEIQGETPIGQLIERLKVLLPNDWQNYKLTNGGNNLNYIPYNPPLDKSNYPWTPQPNTIPGRDIWYTYGDLQGNLNKPQ